MKWEGKHLVVDPPKHPKKITGTRFAAILGLSPWTTPFAAWCAITKTYEEPYVDTIYTQAGKIIEPKQAAYIRSEYFWETLRTPAEEFGEDYFRTTRGDFFPNSKVFGGMWDYLFVNAAGAKCVLEMKTTKRAEDWKDDIPDYYALQAALYAYLLGVDDVLMVASILEDKDYKNPDLFVPGHTNTFVRPFKVSGRYQNFPELFQKAAQWWKDHVLTGISPDYDEKRDAEILNALRTNNYTPDTDVQKLIAEAEELKFRIDAHTAEMADEQKRYKKICEILKAAAMEQFRDGDTKVELRGQKMVFELTRKETQKLDEDALKADGLFDKYTRTEETYRFSPSMIKEEK